MVGAVIRCDNVGEFWGFSIWHFMFAIIGFVGVYTGTLFFPESGRQKGSRHLLFIGLGFCSLFLLTSLEAISIILSVAFGGFLAVLIFKKCASQTSEINRRRFFAISTSIAFGIIILFVASITRIGGPHEITAEKASKIFKKAGGIEKVEQESKVVFNQVGTNNYWLYQSTNFPALSALGTVGVNPHEINIRFGGHFHERFIFITPTASITNAIDKEFYASKCIQVATNIFISK